MVVEDMSRHQLILHKIIMETRILIIEDFIKRNRKYCNEVQLEKYKGNFTGLVPNMSIEELEYEKGLYKRKIDEINRQIKKLKFKENYYIQEIKRCSGEFETTTLDKMINEGDE